MKHFASYLKSGAAVAALSLVPAFAQAATVTTPGADTYTIGAISENGIAVADAALYSLDAMDTYDFIGFGSNGGDVSGFEAEQEFTNNTGNDVVFSASTILLTTEVTGAYLFADVGGTLYDLNGSGTFSVADGDNFTIIWGASDITAPVTYNVTVEASAVPLPASIAFLAAGLGGLGLMRRKKRAA